MSPLWGIETLAAAVDDKDSGHGVNQRMSPLRGIETLLLKGPPALPTRIRGCLPYGGLKRRDPFSHARLPLLSQESEDVSPVGYGLGSWAYICAQAPSGPVIMMKKVVQVMEDML